MTAEELPKLKKLFLTSCSHFGWTWYNQYLEQMQYFVGFTVGRIVTVP